MADSTSATTRRQLAAGSTLGAGVLLLVALALIVNYFGWKYHHRFDLTEAKLYSLSEKTENVLADLERDVEVIAFMDPADELARPVEELLTRYDAASPRISVRRVDPAKNLIEARTLVEQYDLSRPNVVVFSSGEERRVVEAADLAEYDYSGMQMGRGPEMTGFSGEQAFTSAIVELEESEKPTIVFTTRHGELRLDDFGERGLSDLSDLLADDNFEVETWDSLAEPAVPEGTDLVVIAGPTARFSAPELAALEEYLADGGRLLALLDPLLTEGGGVADVGLEPLLADYGVTLGEDIVIDPEQGVPFFGAETFFIDRFGSHPITDTLSQVDLPVVFPLACSVRTAEELPAGLEAAELVETSAQGWAETDLTSLGGVEQGDDDLAGPVSLGVAVSAERPEEDEAAPAEGEAAELEGAAGEPATAGAAEAEPDEPRPEADAADAAADGSAVEVGAQTELAPGDDGEPPAAEASGTVEAAEATPAAGLRLVVYGDSDFATNGHLGSVGNPTLLTNTMNWLIEREVLIAIPPKEPEQVRLSLTQAELSGIFWLVMGLMPGLAVVAGVWMHLRRRR